MDTAADLALFRAERDALAFLGLLASLYLRFDPPISCGDDDTAQPTHFQGLNIHALIIDNADGEVLALEHNQIHAHQSPVEHAEQRALRMAIARIGIKRPRAMTTTVEAYYREKFVPQLRQSGVQAVPLAAVAGKIRELLTQEKVSELLASWLHSLRSESDVRLPGSTVPSSEGVQTR